MGNQKESDVLLMKIADLHEKNSLLSDRLVASQAENERLEGKIDDITDKYAHLAARWEKLANPIIDEMTGPKLAWGSDCPMVAVRYLGLIVNAPADGWIAVNDCGVIYSHTIKPHRLGWCWFSDSKEALLGGASLGDLDWTETLRKVSDLEVVA